MTARYTERDMLDALQARYSQTSQDTAHRAPRTTVTEEKLMTNNDDFTTTNGQYVPSDEDAADNYVFGRGSEDPGLSLPELHAEYGPEFERFLARIRQEAKAETWDEACEAFAWALQQGPRSAAVRYVAEHNPHRETGDSDD